MYYAKKIAILAVAMLFSLLSFGQTVADDPVEKVISDIFEQYTEDSESDVDLSAYYEELMALKESPINLNNTNQQELGTLRFLSDVQIDNLLYYIYRNGSMQTIYELQLVDGFDLTDIRMMLPFVKVLPTDAKPQKLKWRNVFKYGKNQLYLRLDRGMETKEGYNFLPEEDEKAKGANNKKYLGNQLYNHIKYRFSYKDRISFGITTEKDAGEQFWGSTHKGYDFYSAHLELKDIGRFKNIVVGDYRANFAQGLVMRTDFSMGKSSYVLQTNPRSTGLKKYTSTAEYNYFRGAGTTVRFGEFDISAFYSNRMIDGDTTAGTFTSLTQTGLHRTKNEYKRKNTIREQVLGGNVTYRHNFMELGATVAYTHLNHSLVPRPTLYNTFYFKGNSNLAASVNYKYRWKKLFIFGETAINDQSGVATTNGLNISPLSTVNIVTLYRYFSKGYNAYFANTFSETSRVNNESGLYIGVEVRPIRYWKISAYADSYRFAWLKYGIYQPSVGKDYLLQADYAPRRNLSMYWRLRFEEKMYNLPSNTHDRVYTTLPEPKWQGRYYLKYAFGNFDFKNQLDINAYSEAGKPTTWGYSALQDINYRFRKIPLKLNCRFQIFDAQNFNNRIYTYESDVLYAFSIPMNYGMGTRYYLNAKYELNRKLSLWLKLAQTVYADNRETISASNEQIDGNRKTDVRFLLRWKF